VLVATRRRFQGALDIEGLPQVINFDIPHFARGLRSPHRAAPAARGGDGGGNLAGFA